MTKRIYKAICAAALGVFVVTMLLIMGVLYNYFSSSGAQRAWGWPILTA